VSTPALSPRQLEILRLAADGLTVDQTARRLAISVDTVKTFRRRTRRALGAVSTSHAIAIAYRSGLLVPLLTRRCPSCDWVPGANPDQLRRIP
jgi:DNA-binding CsgD family transcriptional regulator